jgi:hypothetical protein
MSLEEVEKMIEEQIETSIEGLEETLRNLVHF